jgi:hypothetical protein
MKTRITSKLMIGVLALLITVVASCKKDKNITPSPTISLNDASKGLDTVTIGKSITFHPALDSKAGVTYFWSIGGTGVGTDSTFTYTPTTRGDYTISLAATNAGGSTTISYRVHVWGKYENGFFIANEGWFGHGTGSLSFYRYDTGTKEDSLTTKENPGKNLNPATSTVEYATIFNGNLYLLTKVGGPLVVMDQYSLKEITRIPATGGNDWRAFLGIDNAHALVSSQTGIYPIDPTTLTLGTKLTSVTGQIADMIKAGNYIFVINASKGLQILNASDYSLNTTIAGMTVGFAQTPDGSVWVAGGTSLLKINPATLAVTTIPVPFTVFSQFAAWHAGSITASTKENAVFIAVNGSFTGAKTIYKYIDGNASSIATPFISIATGKETYGTGVAYNPITNQLVVNTVMSGFGANYSTNDQDFYNATTGSLIKDLPFTGYFFPAGYVFH